MVFEMGTGRINHIGIATNSISDALHLWEALGFSGTKDEVVPEQGVKIRYLTGSQNTRIELLEPTSEDTPVGRFIDKRGAGVQQIAVEVHDLDEKLAELKELGIKAINDKTSMGAEGHRIAFLHPSSCGGVLVELVEIRQQES